MAASSPNRVHAGGSACRAAADLGIEATGRDPEELAELVVKATEARAEAP
jgi:hypothetical protein